MNNKLKKKYDLIYFVGDSFVVGMGQSDDTEKVITKNNRFSSLVANFYNLPETNRGQAGIGNHQITKKLYENMVGYKRRKLNPLVVVVYSDPNRFEIFNNKTEKSESLNENHTFFKEFLVESFNEKFNQNCTNFYRDCVRSLLSVLNFDFVECNSITPVFYIGLIFQIILLF